MMLQAAVSLLNIGARRLGLTGGRGGRGGAGGRAGRRRARPRAGARRDRRRAGAARRSSSAACPQELRPLRDALSQLQIAYRARGPGAGGSAGRPAPPGAGRTPGEQAPGAGGRGAGRSRARRSRAAGCGCPGAEIRSAAVASGAVGRHDRLRPRLRRVSARDEPIRAANVRATILARHANQTAEDFLLSSFLTNHGVVVALVCAACAVAYGLVTTRSLLALSPGNERMQSISLAVQQGARAYLNRQYTTIAVVGRGAVRRADLHPEHRRGVRLRDRRPAVGLDRLHRHERLGARQRPRGRGRARVASRRPCRSPSAAARSRACWSSDWR